MTGDPERWFEDDTEQLDAVALRCHGCRAITACAAPADQHKDIGMWAGTVRTRATYRRRPAA